MSDADPGVDEVRQLAENIGCSFLNVCELIRALRHLPRFASARDVVEFLRAHPQEARELLEQAGLLEIAQ